MEILFYSLPDAVSVLFALLGVFVAIWPEAPRKLKGRFALRVVLALFLVVLGVLAIRSSHIQHKESEERQQTLQGSVTDLTGRVSSLQKTVDAYGPKLDAIIANPKSSPEQRGAAQILKNDINQEAKDSACSNFVIGGDATVNCPPVEGKNDHKKVSDSK